MSDPPPPYYALSDETPPPYKTNPADPPPPYTEESDLAGTSTVRAERSAQSETRTTAAAAAAAADGLGANAQGTNVITGNPVQQFQTEQRGVSSPLGVSQHSQQPTDNTTNRQSAPVSPTPNQDALVSTDGARIEKGRHGLLGANLYVKNIPKTWTETELKRLFGFFGHITSAKMLGNWRKSKNEGAGFVCYEDHEAAEKALYYHHARVVGKGSEKTQISVTVKTGEEEFCPPSLRSLNSRIRAQVEEAEREALPLPSNNAPPADDNPWLPPPESRLQTHPLQTPTASSEVTAVKRQNCHRQQQQRRQPMGGTQSTGINEEDEFTSLSLSLGTKKGSTESDSHSTSVPSPTNEHGNVLLLQAGPNPSTAIPSEQQHSLPMQQPHVQRGSVLMRRFGFSTEHQRMRQQRRPIVPPGTNQPSSNPDNTQTQADRTQKILEYARRTQEKEHPRTALPFPQPAPPPHHPPPAVQMIDRVSQDAPPPPPPGPPPGFESHCPHPGHGPPPNPMPQSPCQHQQAQAPNHHHRHNLQHPASEMPALSLHSPTAWRDGWTCPSERDRQTRPTPTAATPWPLRGGGVGQPMHQQQHGLQVDQQR
eukprot:Cvel_27847.t1-p1 / transcript=Cvel_27847.t1 / gene=Cvel_27847 / organism=Chromera_velia_CCMP2878 / gene_product=RNA binding protein fox-1 homolog 2, putative / transcript_product=RNA binding protein fox-1 homolog 2, putative / location=Cvel_scaffold3542:12361-14692(+) / protein_length=593 / sequence_SO=supercontig / SO=protein_coding / is_pseudo=false